MREGRKSPRRVAPHGALQVVSAEECDVAIKRAKRFGGHPAHHPLYDPWARVDIVRVEKRDHLAGRRRNTFVQRIVDAAVGAGNQLRYPPGAGRDCLEGAVRGAAVHDDVLDVRMRLARDRIERPRDGARAVIAGGYDADLHRTVRSIRRRVKFFASR